MEENKPDTRKKKTANEGLIKINIEKIANMINIMIIINYARNNAHNNNNSNTTNNNITYHWGRRQW